MIGVKRLQRAISDVNLGGMQTGDPKVQLKLADAQRILLELEHLMKIKEKFDWLKKPGHEIVEPIPSLFTFNIKDPRLDGRELCRRIDAAIEQLFVDATRDPRMAQLYQRNLSSFKELGGTIINAWGWIEPNDMWANADHVNDRAHPKYRALSEFARNEPCSWERCDRSQR